MKLPKARRKGEKIGPCKIVAGVKRVNDEIIVTVFPITHHAPNDLKCAVEFRRKLKSILVLMRIDRG